RACSSESSEMSQTGPKMSQRKKVGGRIDQRPKMAHFDSPKKDVAGVGRMSFCFSLHLDLCQSGSTRGEFPIPESRKFRPANDLPCPSIPGTPVAKSLATLDSVKSRDTPHIGRTLHG